MNEPTKEGGKENNKHHLNPRLRRYKYDHVRWSDIRDIGGHL